MTTTTADVVIIGAGVNGVSTAFRLAEKGVRRVVVVEQGQLAAGASGKSGALVRMHYTNEAESRLAYESLKVFRNWEEIVGGSCGFEAPGFLQIVAPEYEAALRANVATQQALGINTSVIAADEVRQIAPMVNTEGLTYVAYEPESGYADPVATTYGFARRAQELGAEIRLHTKVMAIATAGGRVTGVTLAGGEEIAAPVVVLAGGPWSHRLLLPLGLDLGLLPHRIQVAIFRWPPAFTTRHPVIIDRTLGCWLRPEGHASTLIGVERGVAEHIEPDGYDQGVDADFVALAHDTLSRRLPGLADGLMRGGWAGMISLSPDNRPIIDRLAEPDGLYCMVGDSGSCFKTAPATGQCLAEWIVDGAPRTADLSSFSAARILEGRPWGDSHSYGKRRERLTISR